MSKSDDAPITWKEVLEYMRQHDCQYVTAITELEKQKEHKRRLIS